MHKQKQHDRVSDQFVNKSEKARQFVRAIWQLKTYIGKQNSSSWEQIRNWTVIVGVGVAAIVRKPASRVLAIAKEGFHPCLACFNGVSRTFSMSIIKTILDIRRKQRGNNRITFLSC